MLVFAVAAATCWLCALLAVPRKALPDCPLDEVVHDQLRRAQHRAVTVAFGVTLVALLAFALDRPSAVDADAEGLRAAQGVSRFAPMPDARDTRGCIATLLVTPICWRRQPDRSWAVEGQLDDGTWVKGVPRDDGAWGVVGLIVTPGVYPFAGEWGEGG